MPSLTPAKPYATRRAAIFAFNVVPFVSQWAIVAIEDKVVSGDFAVDFSPSQDNIARVKIAQLSHYQWVSNEALQVQWLIGQFKCWFAYHNTILVKGEHEPEYFAATATEPAKIVFAHGFFASSLHEISHWCVAGKKRRLLNDFGYWYAPDGRNQSQQQQFEQVEIMPQAIECLLTLACNKPFKVSKDNLFADFDTSQSTFETDVEQQAIKFWLTGEKLSTDANVLLKQLSKLRPLPLTVFDIQHNFIKIR